MLLPSLENEHPGTVSPVLDCVSFSIKPFSSCYLFFADAIVL